MRATRMQTEDGSRASSCSRRSVSLGQDPAPLPATRSREGIHHKVMAPGSGMKTQAPVSAELTLKIGVLRLLLAFLIVLVHAENKEIHFRGTTSQTDLPTWLLFVEHLVSRVMGKAAVPVYACISGMLLLRSVGVEGRRAKWSSKLRSRVRTLLLPYLLWSGLTLVVFSLCQNVLPPSPYLSRTYPAPWELLEVVDALVLHPIPSQLWFLLQFARSPHTRMR